MESIDKKTNKIKARGVAIIDPSDNSFEFQPFKDGPSSQTNVKSCRGGGKSWETTGADPSRIITLKTKMSNADQYSDFLQQFNSLTKDLQPKQPKQLPDKQRVVCEGGLECWLNTKTGTLTFNGTIDLTKNCRNWQAEALRLVQLIVRRLPGNEKFNKLLTILKKGAENV